MMKRIWWGDGKHDSSDTPETLFHFIKHEADEFGKGLFSDISKNLKRSNTWQHRFIPVNHSCRHMPSLVLFLNKDEFPPHHYPHSHPTFFLLAWIFSSCLFGNPKEDEEESQATSAGSVLCDMPPPRIGLPPAWLKPQELLWK